MGDVKMNLKQGAELAFELRDLQGCDDYSYLPWSQH